METVEQCKIAGTGTPASVWQQAEIIENIPFADLTALIPARRRVVVIAPHPDDEALGSGGILASLAGTDNEIVLVAVSDGEACYPCMSTFKKRIIAMRRRYETQFALKCLGVWRTRVIRLGICDGQVTAQSARLAEQLHKILRADDIVITTWRNDGHPDHDATGRVAAQCAASVDAILLEVPIWTWHWATPSDPSIPWRRAARIALDAEAQRRKRRAVAAYASQLRTPSGINSPPALSEAMLQRWLRSWEMVFH